MMNKLVATEVMNTNAFETPGSTEIKGVKSTRKEVNNKAVSGIPFFESFVNGFKI